jgi:hypothetical protein
LKRPAWATSSPGRKVRMFTDEESRDAGDSDAGY